MFLPPDIAAAIPHREPFLFVDEIVEPAETRDRLAWALRSFAGSDPTHLPPDRP